jgi:hypothetical protein
MRFKPFICFFCRIDSASDSIPAASVSAKRASPSLGFVFCRTLASSRARVSASGSACRQSRAEISFRSGKNRLSIRLGGTTPQKDSSPPRPPHQKDPPDCRTPSLRKFGVLRQTSERRTKFYSKPRDDTGVLFSAQIVVLYLSDLESTTGFPEIFAWSSIVSRPKKKTTYRHEGTFHE